MRANMTQDLLKLQDAWFKDEKQNLEEESGRRYAHFDPLITRLHKKIVQDEVWNPDNIVRHSFYPFIKRIEVTKRYKRRNGKKFLEEKKRPICYATHFDALIYSWYCALLSSRYEEFLKLKNIQDNVLAYRQLGKDNIDFAKEVFDFIASQKYCVAMAFDIEKFFDTLDHSILKSKWLDVFPSSENKSKIPKDHFAIYKAVTDYSFVERNKINGALESILRKVRIYGRMCTTLEFRTVIIPLIKKNRKIGIPQGASVSDVLSNIYMLDFDSGIAKAIAALGGIYKRYCDDIIVVVPIADYQKVQDTIFNKIKELNLIINPSKTELKEFNRLNGKLECCDILTGQKSKLQYLGAEFDGENFYLRHKGITKFDSRMARMIRSVVHYSRENEGLLPKKRLYRKFSHLGASNYLTYAKRAGRKLSSKTIKRQTSPERIMRKIKSRIEKTKSKMAKNN